MVAGSVGTGNLWRYPRLTCQYGGAFVVATVVALVLIAIPLVMSESFAGRATRHSAPGAFRDLLGPRFTWMGTFATFCYFMMHANYTVILAWCIRYMFMSMTGSYFGVADKMELFNNVAANDLGTGVCWIVMMILAYFCLTTQSILEKVSKIILPALLAVVLILIAYALTRQGAVEGLRYSFDFHPRDLLSPRIWLEAITQDFWSLGAGTMIVLSISKYASKNEDIVVNGKVQAFGDMTFALLGTLIVLPCIFAFTGSTEEAVALARSGNNGLTFVGLTNMFESLAGTGKILGTLFFLALSFAAFSSIIAATTCFSGTFTDMGMNRKKAVALAVFGQVAVGLPSFLSQDVLTNQDTVWGFGIFIGGMFSAFLACKFGAKKMREKYINPVSNRKLTWFFDICVGIIAPIATALVMLLWIIQAIGWDEHWWNPFAVSSLATMLVQWGVGFVIVFACNKKINEKTKGVYFDEKVEGFADLPEALMKEI